MDMAEFGVRKRAQAMASETEVEVTSSDTTLKRLKVDCDENGESRFGSTMYAQSSRRITPENSISLNDSQDQGDITKDRISSPCSDEYGSVSCCSSNGSSEQGKDNLKITDLELQDENNGDETSAQLDGTKSKETTTASSNHREVSDEMESTTTSTQPEAKPSKGTTTAAKIPSDADIEEFFAVAEKVNLEKFNMKYNFDFVKEAPLQQGRYEWVKLNP